MSFVILKKTIGHFEVLTYMYTHDSGGIGSFGIT